MSAFEKYKELSLKRKMPITEAEEDAILDELDYLWKQMTDEEHVDLCKWSAEGMKS